MDRLQEQSLMILQNVEVQDVFRCIPLSKETRQQVWFDLRREHRPKVNLLELLVHVSKQEIQLLQLNTELNQDSYSRLHIRIEIIEHLFLALAQLHLMTSLLPPIQYHLLRHATYLDLDRAFEHVPAQSVIIGDPSEALDFAYVDLEDLGEHVDPVVAFDPCFP